MIDRHRALQRCRQGIWNEASPRNAQIALAAELTHVDRAIGLRYQLGMRGSVLQQEHLAYFRRGRHENPAFWSRLGGKPDFAGRAVLDVGCGHGSLCIDIAMSGARKVTGIDIDRPLIEFARRNLIENYSHLRTVVDFSCSLHDQPDAEYDYVVSKDAFEHIVALEDVLGQMKDRTKPGGRIMVGFAPLYNAPYGDHRRTRAFSIPWGHLIIPEEVLIARLRREDPGITTVYDLGLNKLTVSDYRRIFRDSGLKIIAFHVNKDVHPIAQVLETLARSVSLEEYFSHNIYAILEKT